ncbi:GNAT family N-acetyltransferase [bacterium]|nr:GNAT family N-acetyltransferase [bacterium]NUN45257.1 GNAT family N-acetyltransferase [bacterium]
MGKLDLREFEKTISVRTLTLEDFDKVTELQLRCFPGMKPWSLDQFESQIRIFSDGQICVEYRGVLVASSSSLILDFDPYKNWHSWKEISDNGYIRNHMMTGNTLYGIEIMVDPEYRGLRLARRLYEARKAIARKYNLRSIILGGRIPGYDKYADQMDAKTYVEKVTNKVLVDPVLTTQIANGFVIKRIIPNYLMADTESRGYATFLEWVNLDYKPDFTFDAKKEIVRISAVQYQMRNINDFDDFAKQCEYFVDVASDYRSDFILFPEMFTMQLLTFLPNLRPGLAVRKLAEYTPKYLELFNHLSVKYNINIIAGSHFTVENEDLFNIAYLFRRDGTIGKQYKLHITPNERKWWGVKPGNVLEVFDTDCGKISIQICYDIEFPELTRIAVEKGAQIVLVPFCTDERYAYLRVRYCAQARCVENQIYAVIAGSVGNLPHVENLDIHYAQSAIFTPSDIPFTRDAIQAEATPNIETVIIDEINLATLQKNRQSGSVLNWNDRRTDLFNVSYQGA